MGNRGGRRPGAGRKRKWASETQRRRAWFEKRERARLLVEGKQFEAARSKLSDLLEENPAAFDYWAWLRWYASDPMVSKLAKPSNCFADTRCRV